MQLFNRHLPFVGQHVYGVCSPRRNTYRSLSSGFAHPRWLTSTIFCFHAHYCFSSPLSTFRLFQAVLVSAKHFSSVLVSILISSMLSVFLLCHVLMPCCAVHIRAEKYTDQKKNVWHRTKFSIEEKCLPEPKTAQNRRKIKYMYWAAQKNARSRKMLRIGEKVYPLRNKYCYNCQKPIFLRQWKRGWTPVS